MQKEEKATLLYDGNCPMCTAFATHVATKDAAPELIDAHTVSVPPAPLSRLLEEIHLYEESGTVRTGADAILTTISRTHTWFRPIARVFRLPGLSHLAQLVYRFIARRRTLWFGNETSRLYWVFLITNLGLLSSLLLTWPLWGYDRTYPLIPLLPGLEFIAPYSGIIALLLAVTLTYSLVTIKQQRMTALVAASLLLILVFLDITRLQPWVWHYGVLLGLFSFWQTTDKATTKQLVTAAGFVVIGIYFWSGVQKMNAAFFLTVFPWFTETLWQPLGTFGTYAFFSLGIIVPFVEAAIGLGFLTRRFRRTALITATAMFTLVIASLMFGRDWNSSVWPWNVALLGTAIVLFAGSRETLSDIWQKTRKNYFAHITIALFIVLPLGNFFGMTDHYLSWSLYSGHVPTAHLTTDPAVINSLAPTAPVTPQNDGQETLSFVHFSMHTLNAVPYPEPWLFSEIFKELCRQYDGYDMTLTITTHPIFNSLRAETTTEQCTYLR